MKKTSLITGIALLLTGVIALLGALDVTAFGMNYVWPLSLLIPGLYFQIVFFAQKDRYHEEILIPSTILIIYALLFLVAGNRGFAFLSVAWPIFPFGVAMGFLQAYLLGKRKMPYLLIGQILLVFSVMAILFNSLAIPSDGILFPIVLMLLGLMAIIQGVWHHMKQMPPK